MMIEPERLADIMAAGGATIAECAVVLEWHRLAVLHEERAKELATARLLDYSREQKWWDQFDKPVT